MKKYIRISNGNISDQPFSPVYVESQIPSMMEKITQSGKENASSGRFIFWTIVIRTFLGFWIPAVISTPPYL